jgi:hypothetical protein
MATPTDVREADCGDALRERAIDVANHHLAANLDTPVLLVGLRADGREFLLFLDHCFPGDPSRRRQFIAFILDREDAIAYAYASRYAGLALDASDRLHVVAWSRRRVTLTYYEMRGGAAGARRWQSTETHDFDAVDDLHVYAPVPDAHEIDDAARLADYEAAWRSLHGDGTRCFWRWNVGRQQPGFPFPTAFAGRSIVGFLDHERRRPGLGFQASYAVVDDEVLDLYACGTRRAPVRCGDRADDELLAAELAQACDAILRLGSGSWRRRAELVLTGRMTAAAPGGQPFRLARFHVELAGRANASFVVQAQYRGASIRMRLTAPEEADVDQRAERAATWLAGYLARIDAADEAPSRVLPVEQRAA